MFCGYAEEEILAMGKDFSKKLILKEDRVFLDKVQVDLFDMVHNLPAERKTKLTVFLNHRFVHKTGHILSIDMRLTPFLLHGNGDLWMIFACLSFSTKTQKVEAYLEMNDTHERFDYSLAKHRFVPTEVKILTEKEKRILLLNSRGYTELEIAAELNVSINTVKFHKRNIFEKTHSKTLSESFVYATMHKLL
jgi:DNA-binding CsgD family transcriptional regulator